MPGMKKFYHPLFQGDKCIDVVDKIEGLCYLVFDMKSVTAQFSYYYAAYITTRVR